MNKLILVASSLFLAFGPAPVAAQQEIAAFHAKEFYLDSAESNLAGDPVRIRVKSSEVVFSFHSGSNEILRANLEIMGDKPQRLYDLPARTSRITGEIAGSDTYQRALNLLALLTGNDAIRTATSYTTYQVLKKNGEVYVMGINFFNGDKQIGSAVYYPAGIVGVNIAARSAIN